MSHTELVQKAVAILASRGIEATPQEVSDWADDMVKRWNINSRKQSTANQWLAGVIAEMKTPTMCLHVCFGDAQ